MTTSSSIFQRLKTEIHLPDFVAQHLGKEVTQHGDEYKTTCFHTEETKPSFTMYQDDGIWQYKCFSGSCGKSGDIVDLVMDIYNLTRKEALDWITPKTHIEQSYIKPDYQNVYVCRSAIQERLHEILLSNAVAMSKLLERGITEEDVKRFKIGLSDGNLYNYFYAAFESSFGGADGPKKILIDSGIASLKKDKVYNFINEGILTFPVYHEGNISHWILHNINGGSCYQIQKEKHTKDCLFWNQKAAKLPEFWITEGVFDAIAVMKDGGEAIPLHGYSKEKVEFFQGLKVIDTNFPELSTCKTIHIVTDNDPAENPAGQMIASKLIRHLNYYHNLILHMIPKPEGEKKYDIDKYIRDGKKLRELPSKPIQKLDSNIRELEGRYWFLDEKKPKPITNFLMSRDYMYIGHDGMVRYEISIIGVDGRKSCSHQYESKNFVNTTRFREWLGYIGDYYFEGTDQVLQELMKHIMNTTRPQRISIKDRFGLVDSVWLGSNGCIKDGEFIPAGKDGIIPIKGGNIDGIKSSLSGDPVVRYEFPDEFHSPKDIIRYMLALYPSDWVWLSLGFATAMYYHDILRGRYKKFPIPCMFGETSRGKTKLAEIVGSLLGGGMSSSPSKRSSAKGIGRMIACMKSVPVIHNEAGNNMNHIKEQDLKDLIRSIHDGDPDVIALKTGDDRIRGRSVGTTIILTCETPPAERSIINRLLPFNFWEFKKPDDEPTIELFNKFLFEGVISNKNSGWLLALSGNDAGDKIIEDVKHSSSLFYKISNEVDSRVIENVSFVFGALRNAFKALKIDNVLKELRNEAEGQEDAISKRIYNRAISPNPESIAKAFMDITNTSAGLEHDESPLKEFFTIMDLICNDSPDVVNKFIRFDSDQKGDYVAFGLTNMFKIVKERDNRGERKLAHVKKFDITAEIRTLFRAHSSNNYIDGKVQSSYKMYLSDIFELLGVRLYINEGERNKAISEDIG